METSRHPYAKLDYVRALAGEAGALDLPEWGSPVVIRPIAAGGLDAAGAYPMTPLAATADIGGGLERARAAGLVSLVALPDPLLAAPERLAQAFSICRPFKPHYLIDRARPFDPSKHHRQEIRRALRRCRVDIVALADHLDDWTAVYRNLIDKHEITGVAGFSDGYFEALATEPAIRAFIAYVGDEAAAMALWFERDGVVYQHLAASSPLGYANSASYALCDAAIAHFDAGVINLGGRAGFGDEIDGLARFKLGFANREVTAHICGQVLDPVRYAELARGRSDAAFFPAYRAPG